MISLTKQVKGNPSKKATFEFNLFDEAGVLQTKSIKGAGEVSFDAIAFEKAGTYYFGVEEVKGKATGYTYDKNKYVVEITVEDVDGALVATAVNYLVKENKDPVEAESIVFVNKYTAPASGTPDTGDYSNMGLFMALAVVSMMGVAVIFWNRKKIFG